MHKKREIQQHLKAEIAESRSTGHNQSLLNSLDYSVQEYLDEFTQSKVRGRAKGLKGEQSGVEGELDAALFRWHTAMNFGFDSAADPKHISVSSFPGIHTYFSNQAIDLVCSTKL